MRGVSRRIVEIVGGLVSGKYCALVPVGGLETGGGMAFLRTLNELEMLDHAGHN